MLIVTISKTDAYDEEHNEFITLPPVRLRLEHSLVSVSKWESRWKKPFLSRKELTVDETIDYIRCMTVDRDVPANVYNRIDQRVIDRVTAYIDESMTATTFSDKKKSFSREIITSEVIYYWMIAFNIPMECQKWHLSRLLTLINVCSIKSNPRKKKISKREMAAQRRELNAARLRATGSRG